MKKFYVAVLFIILSQLIIAQNPNFEWVKQMGGYLTNTGRSITTDAVGNVYTTGWFNGTADFDPGVGTANLSSASTGYYDIFIQKLNSNGNFLWAKKMGGTNHDMGRSITTDAGGNVYTTGRFMGTADFDPGAGTANLTSAGGDDIFIQKLDGAGNLLWVKQMGGISIDVGTSITTDAGGNVYTTGSFTFTVDFDPGVGTANLTSAGGYDIFIQKLDSGGNLLWVKQMGGTSTNQGQSITTDACGNVYTIGVFQGTADFDPGMGTVNLTSAGGRDIFIQKLDSAGNLLWAKRMGGTSIDYGYSITTDACGNVYTTGYFHGTVDFDPGAGTFNLISTNSYDIFIQKLDSAGNFLWVKQMGGTYNDYGHSITTDAGGNVYTTGRFEGTANFDPGAGTTNLTSAGNEDIFIQKLDSAGNFLWAKQMGGTSDDRGYSITTNAGGNIYTTGFFKGTVDFDPGNGITNLTSAGNEDIFIQKLSQCIPSAGTDVVTACDSYTWIDSITYIASNNTATHTLTNAGGCDSVVTLNLTINNSSSGSETVSACDSYFWPTDSNTYIASGIYNDTITNIVGCDSVITLNLTINNSSFGSETVSACDSYFWPTDSNTYIASGIYNDTITNAAGCDSVVTLNLTIITIDNTVSKNGVTLTANEVGANYQWLDCNNSYSVISGATNQSFTPTSNGNYAVEITKNSCVDTSNCYSITNIGIIENSFGDKLVFYPNPTSGIVNLEFGSNYKNVQIIIRNSEGKLVKHQEFKKEQKISIEIEGSKGIYLIEVISADKKAIIKVVKQ